MSAVIGFQHQPRPVHDKNDCTIRALANALGIPYHEAAARRAEAVGRRAGRGLSWSQVCALYDPIGERRRAGMTVAAFLNAQPQGVHIAHIRGHVFAVRDGVSIDTGMNRPGAIVGWYWTVKNAAPLVQERAAPRPTQPFNLQRLLAQVSKVQSVQQGVASS